MRNEASMQPCLILFRSNAYQSQLQPMHISLISSCPRVLMHDRKSCTRLFDTDTATSHDESVAHILLHLHRRGDSNVVVSRKRQRQA